MRVGKESSRRQVLLHRRQKLQALGGNLLAERQGGEVEVAEHLSPVHRRSSLGRPSNKREAAREAVTGVAVDPRESCGCSTTRCSELFARLTRVLAYASTRRASPRGRLSKNTSTRRRIGGTAGSKRRRMRSPMRVESTS